VITLALLSNAYRLVHDFSFSYASLATLQTSLRYLLEPSTAPVVSWFLTFGLLMGVLDFLELPSTLKSPMDKKALKHTFVDILVIGTYYDRQICLAVPI
jgi:hypothetical protein